MKTHHRLDVTLTLIGPILTRGGQSPEPGIDAPMSRDGLGRPMLPFSLIKGKVLDAFRDLRPGDPSIENWLGRPSAKGEWEPERGRVRFGDFVTETEELGDDRDGVIERIQIDAATGSTAGRMLAMLEAPFGYGQPVVFKGRIEFIADAGEAGRIREAIEEAMNRVSAYGAMRTVGFGRTEEAKAERVPVPPTSEGTPASGASLPIRLELDRPICIVGRKHSRNHFESLKSIPGTVLKGATARLLLELNGSTAGSIDSNLSVGSFPNLWKHFGNIRFAEARPRNADAKYGPVEPPLSVVVNPTIDTDWYDVALEPEPRVTGGVAPAFVSDWKDKHVEFVRDAFGWKDPPTERRTRTAIDEKTGRAAEEQLFSYGLVLPKTKDKQFVWEGAIGLERIPESEHAALRGELLQLLSFGLPNVGKTRAVARVTWLAAATDPKVKSTARADGIHIVTLQTDFLMTDPELLKGGPPDGLDAAYRDFWKEASGGAFTLVRFFARQSLHGGYLAKRFGKSNYEPYLVTDRGSTFVLKVKDVRIAAEKLKEWSAGGLPTPAWVERRYGAPLWKTCPFLPEVGFGEVRIDLECHEKELPK